MNVHRPPKPLVAPPWLFPYTFFSPASAQTATSCSCFRNESPRLPSCFERLTLYRDRRRKQTTDPDDLAGAVLKKDAWRSPEDQRIAFETGHSKLLFGFHNATSIDGKPEALAVDLLDDDAPLSVGKSYILKLAFAAEAEGLFTGVRFGVPAKMAKSIDAAIAAQDWDANVKVGWDPLHVEPTGITVAQARSGLRPK